MRSVDTNALVRLLVRDDAAQAGAAGKLAAPGAWVSHLALAECVWVLVSVYERPPAAIAAAVEMLLAHRHLVLQDADAVAAALVHFKADPRLGFTNCLMLELSRKAGHLPLLTFDRRLATLPGTLKV